MTEVEIENKSEDIEVPIEEGKPKTVAEEVEDTSLESDFVCKKGLVYRE